MAKDLDASVLGRLGMDCRALFATGKMLRARLLLRLGNARRLRKAAWLPVACAVEMVHAASLLHDDVMDGGILRRHLPAFWRQYGVSAAILTGDLLANRAIAVLWRHNVPRWLAMELASLTSVVCEAEIEQELTTRGAPLPVDRYLKLNRGKTGALFAFAAVAAANEEDTALRRALRETGYDLGLCYQLADDYLDAYGSEKKAGKTLRRDAARGKHTCGKKIKSIPAEDIPAHIDSLLRRAQKRLAARPDLHRALGDYLERDFNPVLRALLK